MTNDRILYLECGSGISGDMTVAALLDLGADEAKVRDAVASMELSGAKIQISRVKKSGLDACDFAVLLDAAHENHDHDMAYLHGHEEHHAHGHEHHAHEEHHGHVHTHGARGMHEITHIIEHARLTEGARILALRIFDILAKAEAKAHGVSYEEVHFHEVGAVDSIIDIVAAAVCLDDLSPDRVVLSPLAEGCGTVRCQHGILPVPVPAVTNIVSAHRLPIRHTAVSGELVTPTGAAIAAAVMQEHNTLPEQYRIGRVGIGAGKRDYAAAGILRAMWLEPLTEPMHDQIVRLEANIDDSTGEQLAYCMECLQAAGARDVSFTPVYMKKNRPAYELHVICEPQEVSRLEQIIFLQTTTIGIRRCLMERTVMERRVETVQTAFGEVAVKRCSLGDIQKVYPEYESIAKICRATKLDFRNVYQSIMQELA